MELREHKVESFKFEEPIVYDSSKLHLKSSNYSIDKIISHKKLPETLKDFTIYEFKELE